MFHQSSMSGWSVAIGIPKAVILAVVWQWLRWMVVGTIVFLLLGIGLAVILARRITRSIKALTAPALALGTGEAVDIGKWTLRKPARSAIPGGTSELLRQRTEERERADEVLRTNRGALVNRTA